MTAGSDDNVLVGVKEREDERMKKLSIEAWLKRSEEMREYHASVRRSRGVSFGKEAGKVIIL